MRINKKNNKSNSKPAKKANKRKRVEVEALPDDENPALPDTRASDEPIPKKTRWINKQRVLVMCARGINHRDRHLMKDLKTLMPHHRTESKMERWKTLSIVNEMSEMKHCNKVMLFEGRRKRDLYMWLANVKEGPSVKFLVENINTMGEMKLTGNCLRGSRPILSFDQQFSTEPHLMIIKELLTQIFGVPYHHPKSQPFVDRVATFTYIDKRIWFRHFQILSEDGGLSEVGPRFVMNPIKIFEGSFEGDAMWENPNYQSPAKHRQMIRKQALNKYTGRTLSKTKREANKPIGTHNFDKFDEVFKGEGEEKAQELIEQDQAEDIRREKNTKLDEKREELKKKKEFKKLKDVIMQQKPPKEQTLKLVKQAPKNSFKNKKSGKMGKKAKK